VPDNLMNFSSLTLRFCQLRASCKNRICAAASSDCQLRISAPQPGIAHDTAGTGGPQPRNSCKIWEKAYIMLLYVYLGIFTQALNQPYIFARKEILRGGNHEEHKISRLYPGNMKSWQSSLHGPLSVTLI